MAVEDRVSFGLEVQRLQNAGHAVPPTVRGAWGIVMVADIAMVLRVIAIGLFVGVTLSAAVPLQVTTVAFVAGLGGTSVFGLKLRRQMLRHASRGVAARLERPALGAVGGTTSAGFPALFSAPLPSPAPPRQQDVVKPVRVGDPDAEDFDD